MPEVSVLIPAFRPDYLDTCIASVLSQSFRDLEVLISDDSDGDLVASVVSKWDDPRIRYGRNPRRQEPGANRDHLLSQASGRYVKFAFDDDLLLPRSVELLHRALSTSGAALAFHGRYVVDQRGCVLSNALSLPAGKVLAVGPDLVFSQLVGSLTNFIGEPTSLLLDAAVLSSITNPFGLEDMRMRFLTDVALYTNLAHLGHQMVGIGYLGSGFRLHAAQTSHQQSPVFSAGLFEWELFVRWSADNGHLDPDDASLLVARMHERYRPHLSRFPELGGFLALGTGPDQRGQLFGATFRGVLAEAWATIDERRGAKAPAA